MLVIGAPLLSGRRFASASVGMAVAALVAVAVLAGFPKLLPEKFSYNLSRATAILDLIDDPLRSPTFLAVRDMYILPERDMALAFGTGNLGRSEIRYIPSDAGVILIIYAVGLVGLGLMLLPFIIGLPYMWRLRRADAYLALAGLSILASSLVFNLKELALLTRNMWSLQVILLAAATAIASNASRPVPDNSRIAASKT
jgi:hypothetical protein